MSSMADKIKPFEGELLPQSRELVVEIPPKERKFHVRNEKTGDEGILSMVYFYENDSDVQHGHKRQLHNSTKRIKKDK